jgi:hypothetical protein
MATVRKAVDAFNHGDMAAWEATQTADVVIVDSFAPYVWRGPSAAKDYFLCERSSGETTYQAIFQAPSAPRLKSAMKWTRWVMGTPSLTLSSL